MGAFKYGTERRRERKIESLKRRLQRKSYPRLHASLILLLTGLTCFLVSFTLLRLGLTAMWLRYPLAILVAYGVFLILLRVWLSLSRPRDWYLDEVVDTTTEVVSSDSTEVSAPGGSWGQSVSTVTSTRSSGSSGFSFDLDLDDGWFLLIVVVVLIAVLGAALYVVYIAPVLLAEILLDGVLLAGLYKQVKSIEHKHWLRSAVGRTALPAVVVIVIFTIGGYAMQRIAPEAHSIGEVWKHITSD
jgi:hypothetical protein